MSGNNSPYQQPILIPNALWSWTQSGGNTGATIAGFPPGGVRQPTKTGIMPADLQNFVGVPLQFYGNPIVPVPQGTLLQWIRWAEDWIERQTGILLCQTWVAAPPTVVPGQQIAEGILPANTVQMQLGTDYDLADAPYDFWFPRAEDTGWMAYQLRYRPTKMINYSQSNYTAIQRVSFIYPLLNEFFRVPPQWLVTDEDMGWVRMVPTTDIQLLPLFALYLGFLAFTDSLPGGLAFQYIAGLTPADIQTRYSFIPQLVLAAAAVIALGICQGSINTGFSSFEIKVDNLEQRSKFNDDGPFSGLIRTFTKMRDELLQAAHSKVGGPMLTFL